MSEESTSVMEKAPPEEREREITQDQAKGKTETVRVYQWKALEEMGLDKRAAILEEFGNDAKVVKELAGGKIVDIEIKKSALDRARKQRHSEMYGYAPGAEPVFLKDGKVTTKKVGQTKVTGRDIHDFVKAAPVDE